MRYCLVVAYLSYLLYIEKATVALYFGRIRSRLGVVKFPVFWLFLLLNLLLVGRRQAEIIIVKRLI